MKSIEELFTIKEKQTFMSLFFVKINCKKQYCTIDNKKKNLNLLKTALRKAGIYDNICIANERGASYGKPAEGA